MERLLKQFEVLGTAWRHNLFIKARFKLTALYVLIVATIVCGFSLFLYASVVHNLQDASEDDFVSMYTRAHFLDQATAPIRMTLIGTDIFIILGAAGISYWLAGRTLRPVQESLEAQRLFAAQASHELRTPLTVMRNDAEVMLRDPHASAEELRGVLASNVEEIRQMTQLVENLLILARSEHATPPTETIHVPELLAQVRNKLEPLAVQKGIELTSSTHHELLAIKGDARSLERVLVNLVQNSIEHTPSGGRIEMSAIREHYAVFIKVQDTGSGISSEDLSHIFERFYKGQSAGDKNGSGLGLAIVKEIVEQHGGNIHVESTEGEGTTVSLHFPL